MLLKIFSSLVLLLSVSAASAGTAPLSSLPSTGKVTESEAAETAQKFVEEIRANLPIRQGAYEITALSLPPLCGRQLPDRRRHLQGYDLLYEMTESCDFETGRYK